MALQSSSCTNCIVAVCAAGQNVHITTKREVVGNEGDTVEIPCSFKVIPPGNIQPLLHPIFEPSEKH